MEHKLTECGCSDCEEKAKELLIWVDQVVSCSQPFKYKCPNSLKIASVPLPSGPAISSGINMDKGFIKPKSIFSRIFGA